MLLADLLWHLEANRIALRLREDGHLVASPAGALLPELREAIREHRPRLLDLATRAHRLGRIWLLDVLGPDDQVVPDDWSPPTSLVPSAANAEGAVAAAGGAP